MAAPLRRVSAPPPEPPAPITPGPIRYLLDLLRPRPALRKWLMAGPVGLWLLLFQGVPLVLILVMSFASRTGTGAIKYDFTVDNYVRFAEPLYLSILVKSIAVALGVTLIALLVGYPLAYFIATQPPEKRTLWLFLVIVPFWTSMLIRTYGWIFLLRGNGLINNVLMGLGLTDQPLNLLHTQGAAMLGLVYMLLPFMVLPIYTSVEKLDGSLIRAAYDLGARPVRTFFSVVMPLTMPGVAAGSVLVMIPSIGLFYVADLLGGAKTVLIGNLIQNQFRQANDWPFGSAVSVILAALTMVLIFLYVRSGGKEEDLL
ncbi:MAG: potB [Symbiobacteriaceae bacterium]|jgi:spermidine/putrescine transport system permease protein|nr:potB [Symbiobacteriaceae bacterium]